MTLTTLTDLFSGLLSDTARAIPNLVGGLLLLLVGWVLGRLAKRVVFEVLKRFKADDYFKLGKNIRFSEFVSVLVSWIIYLAFIGTAVDFLNILTLTVFFTNILNFVTKLLGGIVILAIGYTIAGYIQKQVLETKSNYAEILSQVIFLFTLVLTISMAFQVVGIPTNLLNGIILLLVGGMSLGLAIALGLGLRDTIAKWAKKNIG